MPEKKISEFVVDNLRLQDLALIVEKNKPFYDAFLNFLKTFGYADVAAFVHDANLAAARSAIEAYLANPAGATLYDGLGRPYTNGKAKWYFLAWLLRDAPAQRLEPLLRSVNGATLEEKKIELINHLREFVGPLFPNAEKWTWPVVSEIMLARLEGSRRAENGFLCIPIVIAESWGGDLSSLKCEHLVYIKANPNQLDQIAPKLASEFEKLIPVWKKFSEDK